MEKEAKKRVNIVSVSLVRESSFLYEPRRCSSAISASLSEPIPESTSLATKKMFVQLLFINANLQRDVIIENISNGLRYKRSQGKYISSVVPFGYYLKNGQIYQEPEESIVIKRMFQLYLTEKFGYRALAKQLNDEGLTFRGTIFKEHNIWSILNNTLYKGIVKGGSFGPYQGDFQPIIEGTTFDHVQKIRKSRQTIKKILVNIY